MIHTSTNTTAAAQGSIPIYIVDAFADQAFRGNPAAVCLLPAPCEEQWMQQVAAEMNLSETAFVVKIEDGFDLRWFTPESEEELCGHATLATAFVLWEKGLLLPEQHARFVTKSGVLTVQRDQQTSGNWMTMDFPSEPPAPVEAPQSLIEGLGIIPRYIGKNRLDYFVEVDSEATVRDLKPDWQLLRTLECRGIIVTAKSDTGNRYDFVSRAFFPDSIGEDPVTGSTHCALSPYWSKRLRRNELTGYQASSRGGIVRVVHVGDRVSLTGQAIMVLQGTLEV